MTPKTPGIYGRCLWYDLVLFLRFNIHVVGDLLKGISILASTTSLFLLLLLYHSPSSSTLSPFIIAIFHLRTRFSVFLFPLSYSIYLITQPQSPLAMARRPARCYRYCKNKVRPSFLPLDLPNFTHLTNTHSPTPNPASTAPSPTPKSASSISDARRRLSSISRSACTWCQMSSNS